MPGNTGPQTKYVVWGGAGALALGLVLVLLFQLSTGSPAEETATPGHSVAGYTAGSEAEAVTVVAALSALGLGLVLFVLFVAFVFEVFVTYIALGQMNRRLHNDLWPDIIDATRANLILFIPIVGFFIGIYYFAKHYEMGFGELIVFWCVYYLLGTLFIVGSFAALAAGVAGPGALT